MMTYVKVYKFDCCSRKNALDFLTNVLKNLHSFIFSGNSFQIFGPMYLIDCFVTVFLHDIGIMFLLLYHVCYCVFARY